MGAEGIGIYQLIFPIYSLFLVFASGGVPIVLSKLVAECRASGEERRAKRFLLQSVLYLVFISSIFSIVFLIFAGQISIIQGNSLAKSGYFMVAVAIFFASILTSFRGYFQGYQNMAPTAVSQILEQLFKLVLGLIFASIFIKNGIAWGVFGAMLGVAIGEVISLFYLFFSYIFQNKKIDVLKPEQNKINEKFGSDFKLLLKKIAIITLNASVLPLIIAVDSFLIINLLMRTGLDATISTQMFGVYSGMVNSLINMPTIVSLSLAISIVPAISYKRQKGEDVSNLISSSMKIILFISIPAITIFMFFSTQIMTILYPGVADANLLALGAGLLRISAVNILYISLLQITTAILQGSNKSLIPLINLAFAGVIKIILTIFFVLSPMGIYGASVASILCFALASGFNLLALKNEYKFSVGARGIGYILLSSAIMATSAFALTYIFELFLPTSISLILSFFISGAFYLFMVLIFPVFSSEELIKVRFGEKLNFIKRKNIV